MEAKLRSTRRPLNHLYKRNYYWDHDKRLHDAIVAQEGVYDDERHADGLRRLDQPIWKR